MKKLLYIIANSKSEVMSSSRTVSRRLVNAIKEKVPDVQVEELDLYKDHIPQLKGCYFESRSAIVSAAARSKLTPEEQKEVAHVEQLCDQFKQADYYVLAAPMTLAPSETTNRRYLRAINIKNGQLHLSFFILGKAT